MPKALADKKWRMNHLYRIVDRKGNSIPFKLNSVQEHVLDHLHTRNIILKCRQLGMSTFAVLYMLDETIFNDNLSAGIVSYSLEHAQHIFKRIIGHALDHLTPMAKELVGVTQRSAREITFSNGSFLRVDTTLRGGAYQNVLVSEYGKTCARNPLKAEEVITGTLQTVPKDGLVIIESTGEGNEGFYAEMVNMANQRGNEDLASLEYKLFFFNWLEEPTYRMQKAVSYDIELTDYFDKLEKELNIKIDQEQRFWYAHQKGLLKEKVKQEFPSCISYDTQILSYKGIEIIEDIEIDNKHVLDHFHQGNKEVYNVITSLGYSLKCTIDHKIKTPRGFRELGNLKINDIVLLSYGGFSNMYQKIELTKFPCCEHTIIIDELIGRFLGYFVGDGSFHNMTLSIACDNQDKDVIKDVIYLIYTLFGLNAYVRIIGYKKGCCEIRIGKKRLKYFLDDLGLLRRNHKNIKRKVLVPKFIKMSPRSVIANFLRSYFESDGHAAKSGISVKAFSKYYDFIKDIQLLLLKFGITSRLIKCEKTSGDKKYTYIGYELSLRKEESIKFKKDIGFISKRKNSRIKENHKVKHSENQLKLTLEDTIVSISKVGFEDVYDITTDTNEFSAGGITVHNCIKEAFLSSNEAYYFQLGVERAYTENRCLTTQLYDALEPVYIAMDIGVNDLTVIIFFQVIHGEIRIIDYYKDNNKGVEFYVNFLLQDKRYLYKTVFLPHDANHRDGIVVENTYKRDFERLLAHTETQIIVLPRTDKNLNISNAKLKLDRCVFNITKVRGLLEQLSKYRKKWSEQYGKFLDQPMHDESSNYADAFQYVAQGVTHIEAVGGLEGAFERHLEVVESRRYKF